MALELWSQDLLAGRSVMADRAEKAARPLGRLICHCGFEINSTDTDECANCHCVVGDERGMCRVIGDSDELSARVLAAMNEVYGEDDTLSAAGSLAAIVGGDPSVVRFHA